MCTDICIDTCIDTCIAICTGICTDMWIDMFVSENGTLLIPGRYSYGIYSYSLYSYGLHGLYSYFLCSHGLCKIKLGFKFILWWWVGDTQAVCSRAQHSMAKLDQKKIFRPGFLHSRAERESKGWSPLNGSAWIHNSGHAHLHTSLICAWVYTTLAICKTPHLAQMDQARLRGFLHHQAPAHPLRSQFYVRTHPH